MDNLFTIPKDNYLAFDAYTLKQFINDRLKESGVFTDQNLEGSNLSTINNIISYAFNSLMYYLNKTSSEAMFSEAQIYENINRIVKTLAYKPIGNQTSTLSYSLLVSNNQTGTFMIPRYSYFVNGGISYSLVEDIIFDKDTTQNLELESISSTDSTFQSAQAGLLFQGRYREYPIQIATGEPNTIITLTTPSNTILDHFSTHLYIREPEGKWVRWNQVDDLYLHRGGSMVYEIRLNENKQYEIKFGDNINGKSPTQNSEISIYYLESSGADGEVGPNFLDTCSLVLFTPARIIEILQDSSKSNISMVDSGDVTASNSNPSTLFTELEDEESIRKNAPSSFRSQHRLVTKTDFDNFIRTNFRNFIHDISIANNEEYIRGRMQYVLQTNNGNPFYTPDLSTAHIQFADSCNFNNIYITAVPRLGQNSFSGKYLTNSQKQFISAGCEGRKMITSKIIFLDPVYMNLDIAVNALGFPPQTTDTISSYLYIDKTPNIRISNQDITNQIVSIFFDMFSMDSGQLGSKIDLDSLTNRILDIEGVRRIWTGRTDTDYKVEGIKMIVYNPSSLNDIQPVNNNTQLQDFQFPVFANLENISKKIKYISTSKNFETLEA